MAQELIDKIRAAAQAMNLDPDMAVRIARAESSLSPTASVGTSTGKGLFGILDKTWQEFGGAPGKQMDPDENIRVGTRVIASNTDYLRKRLGREPSASEVYAAHFFGPSGASNFFAASPDTPMERVLSPRAIKANPVLQGKTAQEVRALLEKKVGAPAPAPAPAAKSGMTASADDLGQGYKAALALSFLGADEADQPEGEDQLQARMDREAEDTAAAELAKYKSFNALNDLQLSATSHLKQPVRMAEGGEASASRPTPQEIERMALEDQQMREAASQPVGIEFAQKSGRGRQQGPISQALNTGTAYPAMVRGVLDLPYSIVGAPVDLTTMALRPFGYGQEKPVMGSEWIKETMTDWGVRPPSETDPTLAGFRTAGELGASLINPAAPVRATIAASAATGKAAKELMQDFQRYNQQLSVPGASYAIRPRGGPYILNPSTKGFIDPVEMALSDTRGSDPVLRDWFKDKFSAYMRRDMGSPDDQFVKAAEQGKRLHFADKPPPGATMENAEGKLYAQAPKHLQNMRKIEGFNPQGEAQTLYGKHVENKIDFPIGPYSARELLSTPEEGAIPASMKRAALENPEMRFYLLDPWISQELKLEEMHDFMHNMRQSSNTLTRYGQTVTIPEQYRFTDETLKGLTPAQASERVALAKKWVEDSTQRMASQAVAKAPGLISHEYSNGSKWASFPDLAEDSNLLKMVQDVGCDAGWCTKAESTALTYGSEENKRLHILFDGKSRPKAQVTLQEQLVTPNDFFYVLEGNEYNSFMKNHPNIADAINGDTRMQDWEFENLMKEVMNTPEYQNWASQQGARITEIKGVENKGYLANEPYVKEIQDFVRRMDKQYKLQSVANLDGIGMSDLATAGSSQSVVGSAINEQVGSYSSYLNKRIAQRMQELNDGSSYVVTDDIPKLVQRAIDDVMGPMKHSTGGMIERRTDDLRRYL